MFAFFIPVTFPLDYSYYFINCRRHFYTITLYLLFPHICRVSFCNCLETLKLILSNFITFSYLKLSPLFYSKECSPSHLSFLWMQFLSIWNPLSCLVLHLLTARSWALKAVHNARCLGFLFRSTVWVSHLRNRVHLQPVTLAVQTLNGKCCFREWKNWIHKYNSQHWSALLCSKSLHAIETYPGTTYSPLWYTDFLVLSKSFDALLLQWLPQQILFPCHLQGIYASWISSLLGLYLLCYFLAFIRVDEVTWAHWQHWQGPWLQHSI